MAEVLPFPRLGELFLDARGDGRTMRVSLHPERGIAVVSLWAGTACRVTFRLSLDDATRLADLLVGRRPDESADATAVVRTDAVLDLGMLAPAGDLPRAG